MAPVEAEAVLATRWSDADSVGGSDGKHSDARCFEITISLPGVRSASDVMAEVLGDADTQRLSVFATTSGRNEGREIPETLRTEIALPKEADAEAAPSVKFSKKKMVLTVRFPERKRESADGIADVGADTLVADTLVADTSTTITDAKGATDSPKDDLDANQDDSAENPLVEYLSMLGADSTGRVDFGKDDLNVRLIALETTTVTVHATALHDSPGPGTTTAKTSSTTTRSRKKSDGRRRKEAKAEKQKNQPTNHFNFPLVQNVRLAKSVGQLDDMADELAVQLNKQGWATCEFITTEAVRVVRNEIGNVAPFYTPGEIWLGKKNAGAQISVKSVRGDRVFWMDPEQIEAGRFVYLASTLQAIDTLVLDHMARDAKRCMGDAKRMGNESGINPPTASRLDNLADRTHAMLAEYPGCSSRFVKHVDNTARDGRRLTVLCYLNEDWRGEHGGSLKVYDDVTDTTGNEVAPVGGRIAMFYADQTPHEVLPSFRSRHSFTVWYYDEIESKEASKRGREKNESGDTSLSEENIAKTGHAPGIFGDEGNGFDESMGKQSEQGFGTSGYGNSAEHSEHSTDLDDQQASQFVKTMMTENLTPQRAFQEADALSGAARRTAAAVFGAPSGDVLLQHLRTVTADELAELRAEMVRMGMEG